MYNKFLPVTHFNCGSYRIELKKRKMKFLTSHIVFVYSHEGNCWASQAYQSFKAVLESFFDDHVLQTELIITNGSRQYLQEMLTAKLNHNVTHIVTVGYWETSEVGQLLTILDSKVQHLYCLPGKADLIDRDCIWYKRSTGVHSAMVSPQECIDAIFALKQGNVRQICIAYDPCEDSYQLSPFMYEQFVSLKKTLSKAKVKVVQHHWSVEELFEEELTEKMKNSDALITLRDLVIQLSHEKILAICSQTKTLLCSSELDSVFRGAAIGYGNAGAFYGGPLAYQLIKSLSDQKGILMDPPFELNEEPTVRFNKEKLEEQGGRLTAWQESLVNMKSIFDE